MPDGAPAWPGGEMTQMMKAVCAQPCPWDEGEMRTVCNTIKLLVALLSHFPLAKRRDSSPLVEHRLFEGKVYSFHVYFYPC